MGQITKEFAEHMYDTAQNGKTTSLTAWEQKQLAYAWLKLHVPQSQYVQFPPSQFAALGEERKP